MTALLQLQRYIALFITLFMLAACGASNEESVATKAKAERPTAEIVSETYWMDVAKSIEQQVNEAVSLAEKGDTKLATRTMTKVYFQGFEGSKMETGIRVQISPKHMLKVEGLFGVLRKSITEQADGSTMKPQAKAIIDAVIKDAKALDEAGIDPALLEGM